ncbi:ribonuclease P protein component [Olsenella sp. Marseille-QA0557]|uniref:Ribonuclease P protein component n=1 Tax=Candidatus Coprovicinus avistercoris TaxID=2840754 RepID=A0A9D1L530_9ACTN|nr:ribonuclease P protein component [Candidatus Coprovicinus avistercoris]
METIKSKVEFERVFSCGKRAAHPLVRITILRRDKGDPGKVAFVAAKRLGNAVFRNRCKRVLREAARSIDLPLEGFSIILFATRSTYTAHPADVAQALTKLLRRFEG